MNLGEVLGNGQNRTKALHKFFNEDVAHYVPPNLREALGLVAEANPVNDIYQAGGDMRDGDYVGAATNTLAAAQPIRRRGPAWRISRNAGHARRRTAHRRTKSLPEPVKGKDP